MLLSIANILIYVAAVKVIKVKRGYAVTLVS